MKKEKGFTLIELMVTVAIVGILAAVAIPSYRDHIVKSKRVQMEASLMNIAQLQERYFTSNNAYCTSTATCTWLSTFDGSANYTLGVAATASSFTLTATPKASFTDSNCGAITLTSAGVKGSASGTVASCW